MHLNSKCVQNTLTSHNLKPFLVGTLPDHKPPAGNNCIPQGECSDPTSKNKSKSQVFWSNTPKHQHISAWMSRDGS